jgi:hypothetical protein
MLAQELARVKSSRLAEAKVSANLNRPLELRLHLDKFRQALKPELDVAKQIGREILGPQLALTQKFPLSRRRVRPAVTAYKLTNLHDLSLSIKI